MGSTKATGPPCDPVARVLVSSFVPYENCGRVGWAVRKSPSLGETRQLADSCGGDWAFPAERFGWAPFAVRLRSAAPMAFLEGYSSHQLFHMFLNTNGQVRFFIPHSWNLQFFISHSSPAAAPVTVRPHTPFSQQLLCTVFVTFQKKLMCGFLVNAQPSTVPFEQDVPLCGSRESSGHIGAQFSQCSQCSQCGGWDLAASALSWRNAFYFTQVILCNTVNN